MRGYGANPKRNAEIGGVLIGSIEPGPPAIVRVQDFVMVPCQYRRGPSYVFTEDDCEPFEKTGARSDAVGYFRSHTREGLALAVEDVELLDYFFPGPSTVALLVRPYATTASVAGFFVRENGTFPAATPLEFPFRRRELSGQEPIRRPLTERRSRRSALPADTDANRTEASSASPSLSPKNGDADVASAALPSTQSSATQDSATQDSAKQESATRDSSARGLAPARPFSRGPVEAEKHSASPAEVWPADAYIPDPPVRSRAGSGWVWIPMSFLFLLLGGGLGYEAALLNAGSHASNPASEFALSLVVSKAGQNLSVHWDRAAPAIRASRRGVLEIEENGVTKPVDLDAAQLQNGTLTYHNSTNDVHFRLTVYPRNEVSVVESTEWRQ